MSYPSVVRRLVLTLLLTGLVLAGCGGSGGNGASDDESLVGAVRRIDPADQEWAERIVLQLEDFPTGWRTTASEADVDASVACFGFDKAGILTGRADSDDFAKGGGAVASSAAAVYETEADAERVYSLISDEQVTNCVSEYLASQSDDAATITDTSVSRLTFPLIGDDTDARQIVLDIESRGVELRAYLDLITIRTERALTLLLVLNAQSPYQADHEAELATKVAERMLP